MKVSLYFRRPLARIRVENVDEFLPKRLMAWVESQGIAIYPTTPHTKEENGVAERLNRTIFDRVRATLHAANMPFRRYWAWCGLDRVTKTNSMWQRTIGAIPRELWNKSAHTHSSFQAVTPTLHRFRQFGEYAHIPKLEQSASKIAELPSSGTNTQSETRINGS